MVINITSSFSKEVPPLNELPNEVEQELHESNPDVEVVVQENDRHEQDRPQVHSPHTRLGHIPSEMYPPHPINDRDNSYMSSSLVFLWRCLPFLDLLANNTQLNPRLNLCNAALTYVRNLPETPLGMEDEHYLELGKGFFEYKELKGIEANMWIYYQHNAKDFLEYLLLYQIPAEISEDVESLFNVKIDQSVTPTVVSCL